MGREENIAAQQRRFIDCVNTGMLHQVADLVADNLRDHDPVPDQRGGCEGYIDLFTQLREAFPDLEVVIEAMVQDKVAVPVRVSSTDKGVFQGIAPTSKRIRARGVQLARLENGRLVERWGSSDELGILKQLGHEAWQKSDRLNQAALRAFSLLHQHVLFRQHFSTTDFHEGSCRRHQSRLVRDGYDLGSANLACDRRLTLTRSFCDDQAPICSIAGGPALQDIGDPGRALNHP